MNKLLEKEGVGKVIIDGKNRKILSILSRNARTPATIIARKVGLSRDAVKYRIENLEQKGIIKGYRAIINEKSLGYDSYHIFIQLREPTKEIEQVILNKLKEHDFIRAILTFSGRFDIELAVIAKDIQKFDEIITELLSDCGDNLQEHEVFIITKYFIRKTFPGSILDETKKIDKNLNITGNDIRLDSTDEKMLRIIGNDSRISLVSLGSSIGLSADAAKYRLKNLLNHGVIQRFIPAIDYSKIGYDMYAILFSISGLTKHAESMLLEVLRQDKHVIWAVKTIGRYNLLIYTCVKSAEDVHDTIRTLRNSFNIKTYRTLITKKSHKYTYLPTL